MNIYFYTCNTYICSVSACIGVDPEWVICSLSKDSIQLCYGNLKKKRNKKLVSSIFYKIHLSILNFSMCPEVLP